MFEVGRRFVAIYLTCGMISLARFSSASNSQFITTTRKVTTQKLTTVSEKPHSTSRTASVKTIGTVESVSTEAPGNTTDPYAKTSTRSPGETAIRRSSVSSVSSMPGDHSHQSTSEADSVGTGKLCSSASSKLG
ncbi:uncharacterized protein LOC110048361 isoform X1 [Orbicella faveolata]|uniref:uncharacterized protein LOC110048361 isoform X1 n=1 Tax=Orbicella faveolata TaxID=48498 RepID=UPI0009E20347|nr:uncharacterized protein LOC110048361 isoform X1 [Orbicella faveolata]XP_020609805.1 uncharacterized protein LOC110048361 isoform X1 [Orbicella faveolata]XP_020609806.1 uncharacterized protein LOC110048361 isoform X1 [Orbicella faveolata]XP_020609807.1 uncharacterized protein LOC110048361 isoform X1 [Orbicella faveolata]